MNGKRTGRERVYEQGLNSGTAFIINVIAYHRPASTIIALWPPDIIR